MKRFENELNCAVSRNALRNALIEWCMGCDGMGGATGEVLAEIPWSTEMDKVLPWDKVDRRIDEAIGARLKVNCETITNSYRREDFLEAIDKKVESIVKVYDEIIDELNIKGNKSCMIVEKLVGVGENGFCIYEEVNTIFGDSTYDCICGIWDKYAKSSSWKFHRFVDACYKGSVHIKDDISCHIGNKVTNHNVK